MLISKTHKSNKAKRQMPPFLAKFSGKDWGRFRLQCVLIFFLCLLLLLWGRAYDVQILQKSELSAHSRKQHLTTEHVTGLRGSIIDRNGVVLARSAEFTSVSVRPKQIKEPQKAARVLAEALHLPYESMLKKVRSKKNFIWIKRSVDDSAAYKIRSAKLKGVFLDKEFSRLYPQSQLAGRLLGFVGTDKKGLEGLERAYNSYLTGQHAKEVVQKDARGRRLYIEGAQFTNDLEGENLQLTIDSTIQFFAEEALNEALEKQKASWGGCLVVDVASGEILAWAEAPAFDPNMYSAYSADRWRNRLAMDALEPGSTSKPLLVAAALEEGITNPDKLYYCENGQWYLHGVRIRDTKKHAWLPLNKLVVYSSNIGMAKVGLDMGATRYHQYLTRLGFGNALGLPLPGEAKGILRAPKAWRQVDLAAASFGQSFSATGLQLAHAYLALANGGVSKPLKIVRNMAQDDEKKEQGERIFSAKNAQLVLSMMEETVEGDGTGKSARVEGLRIGGKTGTAQKASLKEGGYGKEYVASFIGVVPADKPKHLVLVMIDSPKKNYYASIVASPIFKKVVCRTWGYLGLMPDNAEIAQGQNSENASVSGVVQPDVLPRYVKQKQIELFDETRVPNVVGKSVRLGISAFARSGVVPQIKGKGGIIVKQYPAAKSLWKKSGKQCTVWLSE